jgi:hypothetical protein
VQKISSPKVVVQKGKVVRFEPDPEIDAGINLSFQNDEHAAGFLENKGDEKALYETVAFDFPDELYAMIQYQITGKGWDNKWKNKPMWKAVEKCAKPKPTSDHWVKDKNNCPHLRKQPWIDLLNEYATGGAASVSQEEIDDSDTVVVQDTTDDENNVAISYAQAKASGYVGDQSYKIWPEAVAKAMGITYVYG